MPLLSHGLGMFWDVGGTHAILFSKSEDGGLPLAFFSRDNEVPSLDRFSRNAAAVIF